MNTVENIIKHKLHLPDEMLQRFAALTQSRCVKKKDFFVEQGQVCHHLGIVEKGVLRSFIEKEGEEYIKDFYFSGSLVVAYGSFLSGEPCVGSIQALEETQLTILSRTAYEQLMNESNEWLKLGKYISDQLLIRKCNKETSFLMESANERYQRLLRTYPKIEQQVSQHHLAAYLGICPESLSRLKSLNLDQ